MKDLEEGERAIVKVVQEEIFGEELETLRKGEAVKRKSSITLVNKMKLFNHQSCKLTFLC